jgi:FHA domain/TIR domain
MDSTWSAAFLSYVREDDAHEQGRILALCERLCAEVRAQTAQPFRIFVDRNDIDWGENWIERIDQSLESSTVLIPVITPRYFESAPCRDELTKFLDREAQLKKKDLVLPIHYIDTPRLSDPAGDSLAEIVSSRQWVDWRHLRFSDLNSQLMLQKIEDLARRMRKALQRGEETQIDSKLSIMLKLYGDILRRLRPGTACLLISDGPLAGSRRLLEKNTTVIGRDPDCDIVLPDTSISRRHAEIYRSGGAFQIRDLKSTNGIWVNNASVDEHFLELGDEIRIGSFKMTFLSLDE